MKKRSIITIILLVAVSGFVLTTFYSCKPAKKNIGLQLYSIRDSITRDLSGSIAKVAEMGYTFVEPAGYRDRKFYGLVPVDFRRLCEADGLPVISSHTGQSLPDSANWDKVMSWWDDCITDHADVGAKYIIQPSMGREAYRSLDTLKLYCDYFNKIGEKCAAKGMKFGYHNHDKEFSTQLDGQTIYDFMLQNTDPANVVFEIDLYWAVEGGANPVDYFKKYPGRFELWHIKDEKVIGESGKMDYQSYWANAAISGMKYGIVEVERYDTDEFTDCKKSLDFLEAAPYVVMPEN